MTNNKALAEDFFAIGFKPYDQFIKTLKENAGSYNIEITSNCEILKDELDTYWQYTFKFVPMEGSSVSEQIFKCITQRLMAKIAVKFSEDYLDLLT